MPRIKGHRDSNVLFKSKSLDKYWIEKLRPLLITRQITLVAEDSSIRTRFVNTKEEFPTPDGLEYTLFQIRINNKLRADNYKGFFQHDLVIQRFSSRV